MHLQSILYKLAWLLAMIYTFRKGISFSFGYLFRFTKYSVKRLNVFPLSTFHQCLLLVCIIRIRMFAFFHLVHPVSLIPFPLSSVASHFLVFNLFSPLPLPPCPMPFKRRFWGWPSATQHMLYFNAAGPHIFQDKPLGIVQ